MKLSKYFGQIKKEFVEDFVYNSIFKCTVFYAFVLGIVIHLFCLTNNLFNHDSVLTVYTNSDWLITQGKWFVTPLNIWKGVIALPYLGGIVGMLYVALSAALLCVIFQIRSKVLAFLIAGIMAAFPTVATILLYTSLDYFVAATFLAIAAAYLMSRKYIICNILGVVSLTYSLGAYQAYIGFTASILVLLCGIKLLQKETRISQVVKAGVYYVIQMITALGLYYLILQYILAKSGEELTSYKGISNMSDNLKPSILLSSTVQAVKDVIFFILKDSLGLGSKTAAMFFTMCIVVSMIIFMLIVIKRKLYKEPARVILALIIFGILFPISVNLIGILSANTSFYYVSVYSLSMLFICAPIMVGQLEKEKTLTTWKECITIVMVVAVLMSVGQWIVQNNQGYQKIFVANENIKHKIDILITQIQEQESFTTNTQVIFVGDTPYDFLQTQGLGEALQEVEIPGMIVSSASGIVYSKIVLEAYIRNYVSPNMTVVSEWKGEKTYEEELKQMAIYPNKGSIQYIDGTIVVKLGSTEKQD